MEEDADAVVLEISESSGIGLDTLDLGVQALGYGVRDPMPEVVDQPPEVAPQSSRDLDDGLKLRMRGPMIPVPKVARSRARPRALPEAGERFLDRPGARDFEMLRLEPAELLFLALAPARRILEPEILRSLQPFEALLAEIAVLTLADVIDGFSKVLGDVELVVNEKSLRRVLETRVHERLPHIERHALNLTSLLLGELFPKLVAGGLFPA